MPSMIPMEIRNSVRVLKAQGQTLREISRLLKLSRNAVRRILREREVAAFLPCPAPPLAKLDDVFARAGGNVARVQQGHRATRAGRCRPHGQRHHQAWLASAPDMA